MKNKFGQRLVYYYINKKPTKLTDMKNLAILIIGLLSFSAFSQSTLTGKWYADSSSEPQQIEFNNDNTVTISTHQIDGTMNITTGHYYYEDGSDLLVIITWHNNQARTNKYTFSKTDENLTLSQFYPLNEEGNYYKGQSMAGL